MELCPICIDKEATVFTECNHSYCPCCISRIKKCSMCRKPLLHNELCNEIKNWHSKKNITYYNNFVSEDRNSSDSGINVYTFALRPEDHQPSGFVDFNRIFSGELRITETNYSFPLRPEDMPLVDIENFSLSNVLQPTNSRQSITLSPVIQPTNNRQSYYSFYIPPEHHRPSGTGGGSRVTD